MIVLDYQDRRPLYEQVEENSESDPDGSTGARLQNALCAAAGHGIIDQPQHHPACLHAAGTGGLIYPVKGTENFIMRQ